MLKSTSLSALLPPPKNVSSNSRKSVAGSKQTSSSLIINSDQENNDDQLDAWEFHRSSQMTFQDYLPLRHSHSDVDIPLPKENEIKNTYLRTRAVFDKILEEKIQPPGTSIKTSVSANKTAKTIEYAPPSAIIDGRTVKTRTLNIVEHAADPLQPRMFKVKKMVAPVNDEPLTPVLSKSDDATKRISAEEREKWNIPSAISSWKNPNGYTIALDKRLASDTRYSKDNLGPHEVSDGFTKLSEALDDAEKIARQEVKLRAEAKRELADQEAREKEERLRIMALRAREERSREVRERPNYSLQENSDDARKRELIRKERRKQLEKEMHYTKMGTADRLRALAHNQGRDISEKVILGAAKASQSADLHYDSRLYAKGANAAAHRSDDQVYDNPLFVQQTINSIYRPNTSVDPEAQTQETLSALNQNVRFEKLNGKRSRQGPIEFTAGSHDAASEEKELEYEAQGKRQRKD